MTRITKLFPLMLLTLLLVACGNREAATPTTQPVTTVEPTIAPTVAPTVAPTEALATAEATTPPMSQTTETPANVLIPTETPEQVDEPDTDTDEDVDSSLVLLPTVTPTPDALILVPTAVPTTSVTNVGAPLPYTVNLPPGFEISFYAQNVPNARSMALGDNGTLFVGSRSAGNVYALVDEDGDQVADQTYVIASGLNSPNGVAFRDGSLYVAEIQRIIRFDEIESRLSNPPDPIVITQEYPSDAWHGWKYLAFGPDGLLYVPVGAPCDVCETSGLFGTITRLNADGSGLEVFASGIRNSVGFDWNPQTQTLWFTDNGPDALGDDIPPDELNHAPTAGLNFGFPYCHGGTIADPQFGAQASCEQFTAPAIDLGPHVAALGMRFYTGSMFPSEYQNQILIAEHGSQSRSSYIGYRLSLVRVENDQAISYETFADGWEQNGQIYGRPVDLLTLPDGSLLVSDDAANAIYRITYQAP